MGFKRFEDMDEDEVNKLVDAQMFDETAYFQAEIEPLIVKALELCQERGIPMLVLATFALENLPETGSVKYSNLAALVGPPPVTPPQMYIGFKLAHIEPDMDMIRTAGRIRDAMVREQDLDALARQMRADRDELRRALAELREGLDDGLLN